jgi:hypothetical protein
MRKRNNARKQVKRSRDKTGAACGNSVDLNDIMTESATGSQ